MKTYLTGMAAVVGMMLAAGPTNAAPILYDNIGVANSGLDTVNGNLLASSFSTGPAAGLLVDVKLLLAGSSSPGSAVVNLLSDNSTAPGSFLANIGTVNDTSLTGSPSVFDFPITPIALAPNTRYWIQLSTSNGSTAGWGWTSGTSGTGVANEFLSFNGTTSFSNSSGPQQMLVDTVPVPETSHVLLAAVGALAVAGFARRRFFAAA